MTCTDIDECAENTAGCSDLAGCTNGPGGYACGNCPFGFSGDGTNCTDIDECLAGNGGCDPLTPCTNTQGSRTCGACPSGYTGTGASSCVDIDECLASACDQRTSCTNTAGSFSCGPCPSGFSGDGVAGCVDINECATQVATCDAAASCANTVGGYTCACPSGYTGDGHTCTDIDECAQHTSTCAAGAVCTNTAGGYQCGCPAGALDVNGDGSNCQTVRQFSAGLSHVCAILTNGALYCWGSNDYGELGNGGQSRAIPTRVGTDTGWTAVSANGHRTCGIRAGSTYCWGATLSGLSTTPSAVSTPTIVGFPGASIAVTTGELHSCGIRFDGALFCWGSDTYSQITPQGGLAKPVTAVGAQFGWTAISAGQDSTCGIWHTELWCWGRNNAGQIGDGTSGNLRGLTPSSQISLGGGAVWTSVSVGSDHACAISQGGFAHCWGSASSGQVGSGAMGGNSPFVRPVSSLSGISPGWTALSAGALHTCGVRSGSMYCWGDNASGQIGTGTNTSFPAQASPGTGWTALEVGGHFSCALRANALYCWGAGTSGQLGDGTSTSRNTPTLVPFQ